MIKAKCTDRENFVLVVSIDNLDRCPHRQIVKVLEAAHLLLEQHEVRKINRERDKLCLCQTVLRICDPGMEVEEIRGMHCET